MVKVKLFHVSTYNNASLFIELIIVFFIKSASANLPA